MGVQEKIDDVNLEGSDQDSGSIESGQENSENLELLKQKIADLAPEVRGFILHKLKTYRYRDPNILDNADDLTQEVIQRAIKFAHQFRGQSSLKSWLCSIAINIIKDSFRKNDKKALDMADELSEEIEPKLDPEYINRNKEESPLEELIKDERRSFIEKALESESELDRQIFRLHFYDDMVFKEIADKLNLSEGAVKSKMFRLKERLISKLGQFKDVQK